MSRLTHRSWLFAALVGLGLAAGSGIVPVAAQSVAESAMALLPQAPGEMEVPFVLPPVTDVGSTSASTGGSGVTSSGGISVVIDGNMFGVE